MPALPTATVIEIAKVSEYLALQDIESRKFYNTQVVDKLLPYLLYLERRAVEFMYTYDPADPYLDATTNYLLSLCGGYVTRAQEIIDGAACIPPFFVVQPISQTTTSGNSVTFSVIVGGSTAITYQWYKDGVLMSGKTSTSLTINPATTGDTANYTVIATNSCGTATSAIASLTVNALTLSGDYYYGDVDYFAALSGGTDAIVYNGTFSITDGQPLEVPFGVAASVNKYNVVRYPTSQLVKTAWENSIANNGSIPDTAYQSIVTIGSYYYIISRNAMSLDPNYTVTYT